MKPVSNLVTWLGCIAFCLIFWAVVGWFLWLAVDKTVANIEQYKSKEAHIAQANREVE